MSHFCEQNERKGKVAFLTLGCKVNSYETNAMEQLFVEAGYELTEFQNKADIYVINTCTVTNMADRKSRQMLHRAKKMNPKAVIVAAGCYVQASPEEAKKDGAIDIIVGNNQKKEIVSVVEAYRKERQNTEEHKECAALVDMMEPQDYEELSIVNAGEKTRAYIKIQDGCNQFCSYCIIPYVRGRIRSRSEEDIISEVKRLAESGYQEVVLTGIHLSSYGVDLQGEKNFVLLEGKPLLSIIRKVSEVEGIKRIRLGSLEPRIVTESFTKELAAIEKVCPHFHLSLQSGCDETLKRMNRKYSAAEYKNGCDILRKYFEHPAITTDVIVGFPEETEEEFAVTKTFLEEIAFSDVHIFKYSMRKGTVAAKNKNQVPETQKHERSNQLIALGKKMQSAYEAGFAGCETLVLVEEKVTIKGEEYYVGHNERYVKLALPVKTETKDLHNQIIAVKVIGNVAENVLLCEQL